MDGKTFLLTLVFGFLAMTVLGTYCGIPERGPIMAIAVAGGRIAWLLTWQTFEGRPPASWPRRS